MAYTPSVYPTGQDITEYLYRELLRISSDLRLIEEGRGLPVRHVEPTEKPREGMLVFADGTDWNPGAGAGYYEYVSGAWNKL